MLYMRTICWYLGLFELTQCSNTFALFFPFGTFFNNQSRIGDASMRAFFAKFGEIFLKCAHLSHIRPIDV